MIGIKKSFMENLSLFGPEDAGSSQEHNKDEESV
jgi:hypothetical protein